MCQPGLLPGLAALSGSCRRARRREGPRESRFAAKAGEWALLEDTATGDCAWRLAAKVPSALEHGAALADGTTVFPATLRIC